MKSINKHNYEAYLLDYSEGVLPAEEVAELLLFIEKNPQLEIDLNDFGLTYLPASDEKLNDKDYIKNFPRIEELVIGHTESILTNKEKEELIGLENKHKEIAALKTAYKATILPSEDIQHPNKQSLKRTRIVPLYWWSAVAAAIFVGIFLTFDFDSSKQGAYSVASTIQEIEKIEKVTIPEILNVANYKIDSIQPMKSDFTKKSNNDDNSNLAKNIDIKPPVTLIDKTPKDSITVPQQIIPQLDIVSNDDIALTDNDTIIKMEHNISNDLAIAKSKSFTVKEFLKVKTKEIIMKEEDPNLAPISGNELLASLAESVNAKTKMDVAYQNEEVDSKKITKFKLGKIEFYKSSSK